VPDAPNAIYPFAEMAIGRYPIGDRKPLSQRRWTSATCFYSAIRSVLHLMQTRHRHQTGASDAPILLYDPGIAA
jgi:hypothetical protein